ncbi:MAG: RnfABCDGE type electron transport complex subunit D [Myxococcales bacterium]
MSDPTLSLAIGGEGAGATTPASTAPTPRAGAKLLQHLARYATTLTSAGRAAIAAARRDPRYLQIAFLATFLSVGLAARDFPVWHAPLLFAAALTTQLACTRILKLRNVGVLSAVITACGLTLLLRSDVWWVPPVAAICAIASKFTIRIRGRHFLNPANLGITAAMLATPHAWCSPAQWGEGGLLLLWMFALGCMVAHRAFRSDVSLAFLGSFFALRAARVLWLGQSREVLLHQLASGSLILFAFFMISDPKTTPAHSRPARFAFGAIVAAGAFALQHVAYARNPLLWALLLAAPLTPLFDLFEAKEPAPCVSQAPSPLQPQPLR